MVSRVSPSCEKNALSKLISSEVLPLASSQAKAEIAKARLHDCIKITSLHYMRRSKICERIYKIWIYMECAKETQLSIVWHKMRGQQFTRKVEYYDEKFI